MDIQTKQYRYLKRFVGKEIIRIKPCECNRGADNSFTQIPVKLLKVSKDKMTYQSSCSLGVYEVGKEWLDGNWYSLEDAKRLPKTKLSELQGKPIRSKSGKFSSGRLDPTFLDQPAKLIVATKYHLLLDCNGREIWLDSRYTDPNDWQEA